MDIQTEAPGQGKKKETVPSALASEKLDHGSILSSVVNEISG